MVDLEETLSQWRYYLSLEKQFSATTDFVEIAEMNSSTYSNEYAKLLLLIGSEVDVVAKQLCKIVDSDARPGQILEYREVIVRNFEKFDEIEIASEHLPICVKPWAVWGEDEPKSPEWWRAYNNVKHERNKNFCKANQKNTVEALAGLLVLITACSVAQYGSRDAPILVPNVLDIGFPERIVTHGAIYSKIRRKS